MNASADGLWTADSSITADGPLGSTFSADEYSQVARALLPPGRAWNREEGSTQASLYDALGTIYEKQDGDSIQMLEAFFPLTATDGLAEWDSTLGIPDSCSGAPANDLINQQQIVTKLIASGGQSVPYYTALALALGFTITVSEFSAESPGDDAPAGMINTINDWAHTWRVNIMNPDTAPADRTPLQCLLDRVKPAHTQFYIVDGTTISLTSRLFDVQDNVSRPLVVQV